MLFVCIKGLAMRSYALLFMCWSVAGIEGLAEKMEATRIFAIYELQVGSIAPFPSEHQDC